MDKKDMRVRIQPLSKYKKYKRLNKIGEGFRGNRIYKYLQFDSFEECLTTNKLMFRCPVKWKDSFEKRFYCADYTNVVVDSFARKFHACCFTHNKDCEAAWKMYTDNYDMHPCVRIGISVANLRHFIDMYAREYKTQAYEGLVCYDLNDTELQRLHRKCKSNTYHKIFFESFGLEKYLNLVCLKKSAFKYEGEVRYFMMDNDSDRENDIFIDIPWCYIMIDVMLAPNVSNEFVTKMSDILNANLDLCKNDKRFSLYPCHIPPITTCDLYTATKPILVDPI